MNSPRGPPATPPLLVTPPPLSSPTLSAQKRPGAPLPLTTEPRCLRFSELENGKKNTVELKIVNTGGHRMAWRLMSNAPRLYLVNPNKGFVSAKESTHVEVTLIDTARHANRHQFVVQMKKAGDKEIDREDIWEKKDERVVSNLRITTKMDRDPAKTKSSPISMASPGTGTATSTPSGSSEGTATAISPADPLSHGEFLEEVKKLELEVQKTLDEKADHTKTLTKVVNEVKVLEQELDKETNRLFESSRKCDALMAEIAAMKKQKEIQAL